MSSTMRYHEKKHRSSHSNSSSRRSQSPSVRRSVQSGSSRHLVSEGRNYSPSRERNAGNRHPSSSPSRKKEVLVSGLAQVASSGKKNPFAISGSSVSLRSASVTSLYKNGTTVTGDVVRETLREIKTLSINAKNQCERGDFDGALKSHSDLQQRISIALTLKTADKEATFRRVAADSSFRMGMIHEDQKKDLQKASTLYQDSLEKYRDLRVHLSSPMLSGKSESKSESKAKAARATNLKMELTVKISMVLVKLSENYMKQKRWRHALRVCHDALSVVDHGVERASASKGIKATTIEDMEELQEIILDNIDIIEERSGLSFQATRNAAGKGGAALDDDGTSAFSGEDNDTALDEISNSVGDVAVWLGDSTSKFLTDGAESVYDTLDVCFFGPRETSSVGSFSNNRKERDGSSSSRANRLSNRRSNRR